MSGWDSLPEVFPLATNWQLTSISQIQLIRTRNTLRSRADEMPFAHLRHSPYSGAPALPAIANRRSDVGLLNLQMDQRVALVLLSLSVHGSTIPATPSKCVMSMRQTDRGEGHLTPRHRHFPSWRDEVRDVMRMLPRWTAGRQA